ncbi:hypothetical protein H9P43_009908 [Blastocladiella emersonii ATCC 22665]|nr:hypothetical protein H9P43_009908 [Blastocladiella emersonii ATCC 22665]
MGNTYSSLFNALPLASQMDQPIVVISNATCFDAPVNIVIAPRLAHISSYSVSINGHPYFTIHAHTVVGKWTICDTAGKVVATVRGHWMGIDDHEYTVYAGAGGGTGEHAAPVAMVVARRPDGLDVTTASGIKMHVAYGWTRAAIFLGEVASTTAPLIARSETVGAFKSTNSIWVAPGVDSTAVGPGRAL